MKIFNIILISLIGLTSCSGDAYLMEDYAIGNNETEWETGKGEDNIKLSTKEVAFGFAGGQVTVNAEGRHWWITEIVVDGERLFSMDVDKDAMKQMAETGNFTAQYRWLTIKMENWQMTFIAELNEGDQDRTFCVGVESGDYFDRIEGRQDWLVTGDWDDIIKLSTKEVTFGYDGGQAMVNAEGRYWWITEIIVDGERLFSMNVDKDEMFQITETGNFTAQYGWLTVKMENWQMTFIAEPNYGDSERTFSIGLEAGDYFDRIEGRQAMQTSGIRPVICE